MFIIPTIGGEREGRRAIPPVWSGRVTEGRKVTELRKRERKVGEERCIIRGTKKKLRSRRLGSGSV